MIVFIRKNWNTDRYRNESPALYKIFLKNKRKNGWFKKGKD